MPTTRRIVGVTIHAIDRYNERHVEPRGVSLTWDEVRKELLSIAAQATLKEAEEGEDEIWETPGGVLLSVREGTIRTVLPLGSVKPNRRPSKPSKPAGRARLE